MRTARRPTRPPLVTRREALVALNGFLAALVALFAGVGWAGTRSAPRPGGGAPATLWPLLALQLLDAIAFAVAALAQAHSWRTRRLVQAVPLVLLAAAPVLAHLLMVAPQR